MRTITSKYPEVHPPWDKLLLGGSQKLFTYGVSVLKTLIPTLSFEHIKFPAKLFDYLSQSNKCNINQCTSLLQQSLLPTISTRILHGCGCRYVHTCACVHFLRRLCVCVYHPGCTYAAINVSAFDIEHKSAFDIEHDSCNLVVFWVFCCVGLIVF